MSDDPVAAQPSRPVAPGSAAPAERGKASAPAERGTASVPAPAGRGKTSAPAGRAKASAPAPARSPGADEAWCQPADRAAWRAWLESNHASASGVWVVTWRRSSGRPVVPYEDLIEEALCFGWIDSTGGRLDEERTRLRFTPRRKGSVWARSNKARVERLIAAGRMAPAGLRAIEQARADGSWDALNDIDAMVVPDDLAAALTASPAAAAGFERLSPSTKKPILFWIASAKRPQTRARRVAEAVRHVAAGRSPLEWPRRPFEEAPSPGGAPSAEEPDSPEDPATPEEPLTPGS